MSILSFCFSMEQPEIKPITRQKPLNMLNSRIMNNHGYSVRLRAKPVTIILPLHEQHPLIQMLFPILDYNYNNK